MHCPDPDQLRAYQLGDVSEEIARHVETCAACQAALDALPASTDPFAQHLRQSAREESFGDDECRRALQPVAALGPNPADRAVPFFPQGVPAMSHRSLPCTLGDYFLLQEIGRGGLGVVYRAQAVRDNRRAVAVKELLPHRLTPELIGRFRREAAIAGSLEHPNLVRVHVAALDHDPPYLVMELLDGLSLRQLVEPRRRLRVADAGALILQAARGLDHAHGLLRLVHRDVKPSNLHLSVLGEVKLLDFGLARAPAVHPPGDEPTNPGDVMGTEDYMAPEQRVNFHTVDFRADVYSLGRTLYRLLAGELPRFGQPLRPLREVCREVSEDLAAVVARMLAESPADRFASYAALAAALEPFAAGSELAALARSAPPPTAPLAAPPPLHAALDLLVWDRAGRRHRSLAEPGVLPLREGSPFQIEVRLNRPAYLYLVWLDTHGRPLPLYPWRPGTWDLAEAEAPRAQLLLPQPDPMRGYQPWALNGEAGVETVVLVAQEGGPRADLPGLFTAGLAARPLRPALEGLPQRERGYWFTSRAEEHAPGTRGLNLSPDFHDPIFQIHSFLREQLGARVPLLRAVSFANLGREGGPS